MLELYPVVRVFVFKIRDITSIVHIINNTIYQTYHIRLLVRHLWLKMLVTAHQRRRNSYTHIKNIFKFFLADLRRMFEVDYF